jgi:hypothetical protein
MNLLHLNPGLRISFILLLIYSPFVLLTIILTPTRLLAQKLVQDSLLVSFENPQSIQTLQIAIDSIRDLRDESPRMVGKYEVTQFLFIPVDLDIRTEKPLSREILEAVDSPADPSTLPRFRLAIDEFDLSKNSGSWLFPRYLLNAAFRVYWYHPDSTRFIGEILYEVSWRSAIFRDNLKNCFQKTIYNWQQEFVSDLNTMAVSLAADETPRLENLRTEVYTGKSINLYTGISYIGYPDNHVIDGEMFFSHREARRRFIRTGGYQIRFRNADDFESLSFGLSRDYLFYRLSRNFVFRGKSQLMLGVNRWKDFRTVSHKIYDAVIFEYALGQDFIYNVLDKRSILFGIGLQETAFYIYSKDWQFKIGFSIYLGVKL